MADTILTPDMITKEAALILHDKLTLVNKLDRQYDNSFGKTGAKIGQSLRVRKNAQYSVRTGATASIQDHVEQKETLTVATQKGVDLDFSSVDMTLSLDEFSSRVIKPAISRLAAAVEVDVFANICKNVGNYIVNSGSVTYKNIQEVSAMLTKNTAPMGVGERFLMIDPNQEVDVLDATKGLFQDSSMIAKQYREGLMGRTGSFDFYNSTYLPTTLIGSDVAGTTNAAPAEGMTTLVLAGLAASQVIKAGTILTVAGSFMIQPETKRAWGNLKGIPVLADVTADGSGNATVTIPAQYSSASGGLQNISALPANGAVVTIIGTASTTMAESIGFHKDFAAFVSAPLIVPNGVHMASQQNFEGVNIRFIADYDVTNDKFIARFDTLYGSAVIYPEYGCRLLNPVA